MQCQASSGEGEQELQDLQQVMEQAREALQAADQARAKEDVETVEHVCVLEATLSATKGELLQLQQTDSKYSGQIAEAVDMAAAAEIRASTAEVSIHTRARLFSHICVDLASTARCIG